MESGKNRDSQKQVLK